jgi:O-6-methylguanine DNA methyltransferase
MLNVNVSTMEAPAPIGRLAIAEVDGALWSIAFDQDEEALWTELRRTSEEIQPAPAGEARARLRAYFDGDLHALDALPIAQRGTEFQRRVWRALREIPVGQTTSYGELAARLGLTGHGARAVGMANGDNPVAIVTPCHRVIGKTGALVGYAGGLPRKEWLLRHERALLV